MARTIYISPDSEIHRVPFSALKTFGENDLSEHNTEIRVVTTGREIVFLKEAGAGTGTPVVVANPIHALRKSMDQASPAIHVLNSQKRHSGKNSQDWNPLPGASVEGSQVARIISAALLDGDAASEESVRKLSSPKVLHIASHSFFADLKERDPKTIQTFDIFGWSRDQTNKPEATSIEADQPLSGIVLTGASLLKSGEALDGYLTDREVASLDLEGTELVVISGCDSGVGSATVGDGLYGLQRAAAVAGARSTLLSLWAVDDSATAEFMVRFYKHLKAGESRSQALMTTQREFKDGIAGDGQWTDPYYWAAWQLVGDWRPIPGL